MIEKTTNEHGEMSFLEKLAVDAAVIVLAGAVMYGFFYLTKPVARLPCESRSAVTNNASTNRLNIASNELDRIIYEKLEIKPYK